MAAAKSATSALTLADRIAISTAPGWRPSETDEKILENVTVVGLRMHHHDEYGATPVVVYRKTDGTYASVYAFHTVLRERLAEIGTKVGSVHNVAYLGSQTSNTRVDANGDPQRYESYYAENAGQEMTAVSEDFAF